MSIIRSKFLCDMNKLIVAVVLSMLCFATETRAATPVYTLSIPDDNPHLVKVNATFTLEQDELFMTSEGAEHLPNHWATFVQNMELTDAAGKDILFEAIKPDHWKVNAPLGQSVNLTYEVVLKHADYQWPHQDREAAYARDWGVFYVGRGLFILPSPTLKNTELNFTLPKDWHVSTPWKKKTGTPNSYVADNAEDLLQAAIFAGTHVEFSIKEGGTEIIFALGGEPIIAAQDLFEEVTRAMLKAYIKMFGGAPPDSRMLIIINPEYLGSDGGGVFNRSISMTFTRPPTKQSMLTWGHILSHEIFHMWNGVAIKPATVEDEWFKEGVTDYYSFLFMTRLGFFNERMWDFKNGDRHFLYFNSPAQLSIRKAGFEKPKYADYLYGGGLTLALALDLDIRQRTHHQKSLDTVMRALYQEYGNTRKSYTMSSLLKTIKRATGFDYTELFKQYVEGTARLPLEPYLNYAGLTVAGSDQSAAAPSPQRVARAISRKAEMSPTEQEFLATYLGR